MKFIVEVNFPLEPFSTYVRNGTAGEKIGEVLGAINHEGITRLRRGRQLGSPAGHAT